MENSSIRAFFEDFFEGYHIDLAQGLMFPNMLTEADILLLMLVGIILIFMLQCIGISLIYAIILSWATVVLVLSIAVCLEVINGHN